MEFGSPPAEQVVTITLPGEWTLIDSEQYLVEAPDRHNTIGVFAKVAEGDEDSTTVDFATNVATQGTCHVYRIDAASWFGDIATGIAITGTFAKSNDTAPNPPSLTIPWGAADTMAIAICGAEDQDEPWVSSAPSTYTNLLSNWIETGSTNKSMIATRRNATWPPWWPCVLLLLVVVVQKVHR
jgi:hypothetical protein